MNLKEKIINCINQIIMEKGKTVFYNDCLEHSFTKIKYPLGINGTVVYPSLNYPVTKKGDDLYVKGLEVMTGENYNLYKPPKSGKDRLIKESYLVPEPPIGWWLSEKLDGQRAIWDGAKFVSRGSGTSDPRVYPYVPKWFVALMPPSIALDGELYIARNSFSETTSILKTKLKTGNQEELDTRWTKIKFVVFDVLNESFLNDKLFVERKELLRKIVQERCKVWESINLPLYLAKGPCPLVFTEQYLIKSENQLNSVYTSLTSQGAEGVMIRANVPYIPRRSRFILKLKLVDDAECVIKGPHKPGEGKYQGMLGSFRCEMPNGKIFYVGGMDDNIRKNYKIDHPDNTIIVYTFNGITPDGIPRHPRYKGIKE
jgi:DNA ligase-1